MALRSFLEALLVVSIASSLTLSVLASARLTAKPSSVSLSTIVGSNYPLAAQTSISSTFAKSVKWTANVVPGSPWLQIVYQGRATTRANGELPAYAPEGSPFSMDFGYIASDGQYQPVDITRARGYNNDSSTAVITIQINGKLLKNPGQFQGRISVTTDANVGVVIPITVNAVRGDPRANNTMTQLGSRPFIGANMRAIIGRGEYVTDPMPTYQFWAFPDLTPHLHTGFPQRTVRMYTGFGASYVIIKGNDLTDVLNTPERVWTPTNGQATSVLSALHVDNPNQVTRGWLHSEQSAFWGEWDIRYSESRDYGTTWSMPEIAVTSEVGCRDRRDMRCGTGPHYVVPFANGGTNYYYMYISDFVARWPDGSRKPGYCMARSLYSDGGRPGSWKKLYNGQFSEPGLRGKCSVVEGLTGAVVTPIQMGNRIVLAAVNTQGGLPMSFSTDGVTWSRIIGRTMPMSLISDSVNWNGFAANWHGFNAAYLSLSVDPKEYDQYGRPRTWLYGAYVQAGDTVSDHRADMSRRAVRNMIRYEVQLFEGTYATAWPGCGQKLALSRFQSGSRTWITNQPVNPSRWRFIRYMGYTHTCYSTVGIVDLVECRAGSVSNANAPTFIALRTECTPDKRLPDGTKLFIVGSVGRGYTSATIGGPSWNAALYRCKTPTGWDISVGRPCASSNGQQFLAYISAQGNGPW